jgi:hypothetical protein
MAYRGGLAALPSQPPRIRIPTLLFPGRARSLPVYRKNWEVIFVQLACRLSFVCVVVWLCVCVCVCRLSVVIHWPFPALWQAPCSTRSLDLASLAPAPLDQYPRTRLSLLLPPPPPSPPPRPPPRLRHPPRPRSPSLHDTLTLRSPCRQ